MGALVDLLNRVPLAGLMLVVALGWLLGRPERRGVTLSPAGGALLVGLVLGHWGLDLDRQTGAPPGVVPRASVGTFGFALFIYAVGFEAGPGFLEGFRGRGLRFVGAGVAVNVVAVTTLVGLARLLGVDADAAAGALAGALTSTPALVSASAIASEPARATVAYALTYPFGSLGLLALIGLLPRALGHDLTRDAGPPPRDDDGHARGPTLKRVYRLTRPDTAGQTLRALDLRRATGALVTRLARGPSVLVPDADTPLRLDDRLYVSGPLAAHQAAAPLFGPEVFDAELRDQLPAPRRIHVGRREALGQTLAALRPIARHGVLVTGWTRAGQPLDVAGDLPLAADDVLEVVGRRKDVAAFAQELGQLEQSLGETNVALYAGGVLAGVLLGALEVEVAGVRIGLGAAGGLLLAGIVLGRVGRVGPWSARVPLAARRLVRDLGILLFIGEAGVRGGRSLAGGAGLEGAWAIVALGAAVTVAATLGGLLVARRLLRLHPLDAWGSLCGGMTSTAALEAVNRQAEGNRATIAYSATYALATVLVTVAGQAVVAALR